ncbi:MAG: hypothetical protein ACI8PZ_007387 [Myxococcota bacterium]|jgi:hypothetical protein
MSSIEMLVATVPLSTGGTITVMRKSVVAVRDDPNRADWCNLYLVGNHSFTVALSRANCVQAIFSMKAAPSAPSPPRRR